MKQNELKDLIKVDNLRENINSSIIFCCKENLTVKILRGISEVTTKLEYLLVRKTPLHSISISFFLVMPKRLFQKKHVPIEIDRVFRHY